ncbi:MAG: hypothetical protein V3U96_10545 [Paracoccaceae bacterium]
MKRLAYFILWTIVLACPLPLVAGAWSSWFATKHGCTFNGSNYHPCIVNGTDWGHTLGAALISGWLLLITIPMGVIALLAIITIAVTCAIRKRIKSRPNNA